MLLNEKDKWIEAPAIHKCLCGNFVLPYNDKCLDCTCNERQQKPTTEGSKP